MKNLIFIIMVLFYLGAYAQVNTNSSGVQTFSISKKQEPVKEPIKEPVKKEVVPVKEEPSTTKTTIDEKGSGKEIFLISKKDETAPEIMIVSPKLIEGTPFLVNSMKLQLTGKTTDESGILSVLVNNEEAVVAADGSFQIDVLLAYGQNTIQVKSIDINKNIAVKSYTVERKAGEISQIEAPVKNDIKTKDEKIKIEWKMTGKAPYKSSLEKYTITACINSTDPVSEVKLYQNDKLVSEVSHKDIAFRGDCTFNVNEHVTLIEGANEFKIYISTATGFNESETQVIYNFFSSRYYALVIGVEDYTDDEITDLAEPVKDATELAEILETSYTFNKDDIILLTNPTKADIIGTLHSLRKQITENDNLLIFYAGHGYWDEEMNLGYWLPSDAEKDNPVNWLPNTDLTNYLSAIKSKHTLLIADACFSGGIFKTRAAFNNDMAMEKLFQLKSRKAITSGTLTEVPDKSVFVEYLFKYLENNTNNYVSSEQLFSEIRMAVINNSMNIPQFGTIHNTGDEGGDFIFIKK